MTSTNNFVGIGEAQRVSSRVKHPPGGHTKFDKEARKESRTVKVLKPPGGGSSIVFAEDDHPLKPKASPQSNKAPAPEKPAAPEKAPAPEKAEAPAPAPEKAPQETPAKTETNGTASSPPDTPSTNTTTTTPDSFPSVNGSATETPAPAVNGTTNGTTNGTRNGTSTSSNGGHDDFPAINGSSSSSSPAPMSQGTPSTPSNPSTPSTPSSASRLDTQNRLFGADPVVVTPSRRLRDHHRSNIFTEQNANKATNGTPKPATPSVASESSLGDKSTPTEQPKSQRQRIPPGGFSTQLW